jgi:hypothetical protein
MKRLKFTLLIISACSVFSCTRKCVKGPESPLASFLAKSTFSQTDPLRQQGVPSDEIGFRFRPKVNGSITAFSVKIPNVAADVPVTLWDGVTNMPLKTILINVTASDFVTTVPTSAIPLVAGREYVMSMNTSNSYDYQNADNATAYPITVCNIEILNACYNFGFGTSFPGQKFENTKFRGNVDFVFEADE